MIMILALLATVTAAERGEWNIYSKQLCVVKQRWEISACTLEVVDTKPGAVQDDPCDSLYNTQSLSDFGLKILLRMLDWIMGQTPPWGLAKELWLGNREVWAWKPGGVILSQSWAELLVRIEGPKVGGSLRTVWDGTTQNSCLFQVVKVCKNPNQYKSSVSWRQKPKVMLGKSDEEGMNEPPPKSGSLGGYQLLGGLKGNSPTRLLLYVEERSKEWVVATNFGNQTSEVWDLVCYMRLSWLSCC